MKINSLIALLSLPLALILSSCVQARVGHPALWRVRSPTATIYLFGSIHALPADEQWRTPALTKAEAEADTLVLELTDIDDQEKVKAAVREVAFAPNLPDVLDRVPAAKRAGLAALLARSGTPLSVLKTYKTWAVYLFGLTPIEFSEIGVDSAEGVERKLSADFKAASKPITGLETFKYQLGIFDALPEAVQRKLLAQAVDEMPKARAEFFQTLRAWE